MIAPTQLAFAPPAGPQEPEPGTPERRVLRVLRHLDGSVCDCTSHDRGFIAAATCLSDRAVRRAIASLVAAGFPIVSASDSSGYRLASEPDELDHAIAELASREQALRERRQGLVRAQQGMRLVQP